MPPMLAFALFICLIHLAVFFTSSSSGRILKAFLGAGLGMAGLICGLVVLALSLDNLAELILEVLTLGLPVLSLLVYLPSWWRRSDP